jgi:hypothetical protein
VQRHRSHLPHSHLCLHLLFRRSESHSRHHELGYCNGGRHRLVRYSLLHRLGSKSYKPPNETVDDYIERYAADAASMEKVMGGTNAEETLVEPEPAEMEVDEPPAEKGTVEAAVKQRDM